MKSRMIAFRVLPEEREALESLARLERYTLSETLRWIVRSVARERGLWPPNGVGREAGQDGKSE
jgi:hypothetical protein